MYCSLVYLAQSLMAIAQLFGHWHCLAAISAAQHIAKFQGCWTHTEAHNHAHSLKCFRSKHLQTWRLNVYNIAFKVDIAKKITAL